MVEFTCHIAKIELIPLILQNYKNQDDLFWSDIVNGKSSEYLNIQNIQFKSK